MTQTLKKIIYLLLGAAAGGLVWFTVEMQMMISGGSFYLRLLLLGGTIGAIYGAVLGTGEGIALSIGLKSGRGALIGFGIGFLGGLVSISAAQGILLLLTDNGGSSMNDLTTSYLPLARIPGWALIGAVVGSVEGIRTASIRRFFFGLLGGVAGGFLGGLLYELFNRLSIPESLRRLSGFVIMGVLLGAGLSIADAIGRYGKLKVMNGAFKGKEFIISRGTTIIGSSMKCDVVLPEDSQVEGIHARLVRHNRGILIERMGEKRPLYVNDERESKLQLKYEDVIRCGHTVLRFVP